MKKRTISCIIVISVLLMMTFGFAEAENNGNDIPKVMNIQFIVCDTIYE